MARSPNRARIRAPFHHLALALSTTCALVALAGTAQAQSAQSTGNDDQQIEEIVVTGLRRGLQDSIQVKKEATGIVEAVSAEDIGKLPDVSIAESLARLPGLAGQRVNGRVQVLSIRGLSPDFSNTLLNGRQQVSTGDNRAVEYDQYPSELISSAVIYKTADAGLTGQGLSGTADMRTIRPLEFGKRALSVNVRGEMNSLGKLNDGSRDLGGRASISYIDQFADGKVGVALGYAHLDSPSQIKHYKAWWWDTQDNRFGAGNTDALGLQGAEVTAVSRRQVRDGVMGVLELKPNDVLHTTIDAYYSSFSQDETMSGSMWLMSRWNDDISFTNPTFENVNGTKLNTGGTVKGVTPIIRNDFNKRDDDMVAIGINNQLDLGRWNVGLDFGYSRATRDEQVLETYAGYAPIRTGDTMTYSIPQSGIPTFKFGYDYADAAKMQLGDPAPGGWGHDGAIRYPHVKDTLYTARATAGHDVDGTFLEKAFKGFEVGVDYNNRKKSHDVADNDLFLKNGRKPVAVGSEYLRDPTDLGYAGMGGVMAFNVMDALNTYYNIVPIDNADQWNKAWKIKEDVTTGFAKLNIDAEIGSIKLRGNVGAQLVHAKQSSEGYGVNYGDQKKPTPLTGGASTTDFLPSLNLVGDLGDDAYIRFGLGKTMARPRMDDLRASVSASVDTTTRLWSGNGGNPNLKPWRATAVDLSVEKYFAKATYIGLAGFYKDMKTYIYNQTLQFDFSGVPVPATGGVPVSNIGSMTQPANGSGGNLKGIELSGAIEGEIVHPWLEGFGVLGSLSRIWTNILPDGPGSTNTLPGLSGTTTSVTAYYEKDGFSTRISKRYRSAYRGEVNQLYATRGYTEILADKQVDFQMGYTVQGGDLEGLGVLFQVNNLTDAPYRTRTGTTLSDGSFIPETYERYGRQFMLGLNYRM